MAAVVCLFPNQLFDSFLCMCLRAEWPSKLISAPIVSAVLSSLLLKSDAIVPTLPTSPDSASAAVPSLPDLFTTREAPVVSLLSSSSPEPVARPVLDVARCELYFLE